jgi:hypothetical protein
MSELAETSAAPPENLEVSERKRIILLSQFSPPMLISLTTLLATLCSIFRSRVALELENLALRHQIGVLQRSARKRLRVNPSRPPFVGLAVPDLGRLALGTCHRQARNGVAGMVPVFGCSGSGRCGTTNPNDLPLRARSEI